MQLNELQRFAKNFTFKILSTIITGLISIFIVRHLSSALLPEGFGTYNFLLTYTSYFIFLTSLGTDIVAIRMMAVEKENLKKILGSLITLKLLLTFATFVIMLIPMIFVPNLRSFGLILVVFAATILPFPFSVQCVFEATKRIEFPSLISIGTQLLTYVLLRVFVNSPNDLLAIGLVLTAINSLIFILHNIIFIKYYGMWKFSIDRILWINFLRDGFIIGFIQVIVNMNHYFNVFLLHFMKTDYEVGIFSAAYRVMFIIISVIAIFPNLMTPILFENYKLNLEKYKFYFDHYLKFIVFFSYFTACMSFFLAEPILDIFYDLTQYRQSITVFRILTGSIFLVGLNTPFNVGLLSMHKEKTLLKIIIVLFTTNFVLNLLLIPRFGIYGSSMATVTADFICIPIYIYVYRAIVPVRTILKYYLLATVSIIPTALVLHFLDINFILEAIIGTVTMIASTLLFRGYTLKEVQFITGTLFNLKNDSR